MKTIAFILFAAALLTVLADPQQHKPVAVLPDGFSVSLDVADTPEERSRGLQFRKITENQGMLFVFDEPGAYTFWMKNVPQPLDIVFLSQDWHVGSVFASPPPCFSEICPTYASLANTSYVIELYGGMSQKHGVQPGTLIEVTR